MSNAAKTESSRPESPAALRVARRIPATLIFVAVILIVGIAGQGLWRPLAGTPLFDAVAYGLPALEQGRWWTPITGTFFVIQPWVYIPTILGFWGMAYLEHRRGWRVALLYYWFGQLFAIFGAALLFMGGRALPWMWAQELSQTLDVGASGGAMACSAAAIGLFAAPWRQRAWLVLIGFAAISLLYLGTLADVEHALAILLILGVDRSLRMQRTTAHEQRLLAVSVIIALGVIQLIVMLVPTNGPFGQTDMWLETALPDVLFDTAVIVVIGLGLWRGRRWAWIIAIILAAINIVVGALAITARVLLLVAYNGATGSPGYVVGSVQGDVDVTISAGFLWFAYLIFLIATRAAFRVWRRARSLGGNPVSVDEVKQIIREDGSGTLSWMTTWQGMEYLRTTNGIVPFQLRSGVAIALADPLGAPAGHVESVAEFIAAAEAHAVTPCFFSASSHTRDLLPDEWHSLTIADDTIIDLTGLTFQGKAWAQVRQSFSKGERERMTFRLTTLSEVSWGTRQQLRAISESWVGDKGLPEMRFTLGTLQEAEDPEVRLALAISPEGDVDGLLSWLPVYGAGGRVTGWTLDLMRRRDGGFGAVMEFLIGSSAKAFSEEGAEILSLSGAPLAHEAPVDEGVISSILARMGGMLEPVYGFRSLHRFKKKFNPRYEPIYLLYRDEGDLARIGGGLTKAFLPDATLRQFAEAGVDLIRN